MPGKTKAPITEVEETEVTLHAEPEAKKQRRAAAPKQPVEIAVEDEQDVSTDKKRKPQGAKCTVKPVPALAAPAASGALGPPANKNAEKEASAARSLLSMFKSSRSGTPLGSGSGSCSANSSTTTEKKAARDSKGLDTAPESAATGKKMTRERKAAIPEPAPIGKKKAARGMKASTATHFSAGDDDDDSTADASPAPTTPKKSTNAVQTLVGGFCKSVVWVALVHLVVARLAAQLICCLGGWWVG